MKCEFGYFQVFLMDFADLPPLSNIPPRNTEVFPPHFFFKMFVEQDPFLIKKKVIACNRLNYENFCQSLFGSQNWLRKQCDKVGLSESEATHEKEELLLLRCCLLLFVFVRAYIGSARYFDLFYSKMAKRKYDIDETMQFLWSSVSNIAADPDSDIECFTDTEENEMEIDDQTMTFSLSDNLEGNYSRPSRFGIIDLCYVLVLYTADFLG